MSRLKRLKDVSQTATLFDRQYGYNNASQISQIIEPTLTRTIGYGLIDRLIGVTIVKVIFFQNYSAKEEF
jgi:hypothetical protein